MNEQEGYQSEFELVAREPGAATVEFIRVADTITSTHKIAVCQSSGR